MAVERLSDEPIILAGFNDSGDEHAIIGTYMQTVDVAKTIAGPVYRVFDLRQAASTFPTVVSTIQELAKGMTGAAVYPEMAIAFVGQPHMLESHPAFFTQIEEAIAYAREQIAEGITTY